MHTVTYGYLNALKKHKIKNDVVVPTRIELASLPLDDGAKLWEQQDSNHIHLCHTPVFDKWWLTCRWRYTPNLWIVLDSNQRTPKGRDLQSLDFAALLTIHLYCVWDSNP